MTRVKVLKVMNAEMIKTMTAKASKRFRSRAMLLANSALLSSTSSCWETTSMSGPRRAPMAPATSSYVAPGDSFP